MTRIAKHGTVFLLFLLTSTLMLLVFSHQAFAQEGPPPTVVTLASVGGTVNPAPGTYVYAYGDTINITATPSEGYEFKYWIIDGEYTVGNNVPDITYPSDVPPDWIPGFDPPSIVPVYRATASQNPLTIICGYGYTFRYQAVFAPIGAPSAGSNAVAIILAAVGGTTNPAPGTYTYLANQTISLTATPDSGYEFKYWNAKGSVPGHDAVLLDKTVAITCQAGYVYSYQPVFAPSSAALPSAGMPVEYWYAIVAVLAIIAVIGVAAALMYRGKSKPSPT